MTYHPNDTICAIATSAGGAARGMIRISGPRAVGVAAACFEAADGRNLSELRRAECVAGSLTIELFAGAKPRTVPCGLFIWPTSRSYTREPVVELHTLGAMPILEAVLAAVCRCGARLAEPGEFTLRAFLAGRVDLTQAEAVLGVIDAQGDSELSNALAQLAGGMARPLHELRDQLLQLLAELEAGLDFVEEDIEFVTAEELVAQLESARERLASVAQQMTQRGTAGTASQVVLTGLPNAGKSSLFNALVARFGVSQISTESPAQALVSSQRGTTRDYLTATVEFAGARCELVDTAGVEELEARPQLNAGNPINDLCAAAQRMAHKQRERATIRVWCLEGAAVESSRAQEKNDRHEAESDLIVVTKGDLISQPDQVYDKKPAIVTSSITGEGLDELGAALLALLVRDSNTARGQVVAATAERCRESIRLAGEALQLATALAQEESGNELVAIELRNVLAELGKVVGAVYTDDLLDRIFKTFCIGK